MASFITIAVLVCQVAAPGKKLLCYDKGSENLRSTEVKSSAAFTYYKCSDSQLKSCDNDTKWDGCKFTMNDKTVAYSSYTCP